MTPPLGASPVQVADAGRTAGRASALPAAAPGLAGIEGLLEAIPFASAAYAAGDGALAGANRRFRNEFSSLPRYRTCGGLLADLGLGAEPGGPDRAGRTPDEVQLPGSGRWYALHWGLGEHGGESIRVLTAVDISERLETLDSHKAQQEKLLFTSRLMSVGEMAATLAHELNQPLAAILNYLNGSLRLVARAGGPDQVEGALRAARVQAEHASAVIARVREFVRAREPKREAHDLAAIVGTVLELLRLEAERQHLSIQVALAPGLPNVHADRVMIEQVLLNLVKNAIEAMRETPPSRRGLRVEGRLNLDGDVEVRVVDRGAGLSAGEQDQLFSAFFTTKSDGLGIGLAICRSIIEYHEGRLFFEPLADGGSVFGFTLPQSGGRG